MTIRLPTHLFQIGSRNKVVTARRLPNRIVGFVNTRDVYMRRRMTEDDPNVAGSYGGPATTTQAHVIHERTTTVLNPLTPSFRGVPLVDVAMRPPMDAGMKPSTSRGLFHRKRTYHGADGGFESLHVFVSKEQRGAFAQLLRAVSRGDVAETLRVIDGDAGRAIVNACEEDGRRAMHYAAASGHVGCIEALISRGAECDARTRNGRTPSHEAAKHGHDACLTKIFRAHAEFGGRKADANARDASGSTPLHEATQRRAIEVLLREGADGNVRRGDGSTALHLACDRGDGWATEALLGCGADCDARDGVGRTPLHRAVDRASARALVNSGADVDVMTDEGYSPLHVAAMDGKAEIVTPLVNAGAQIRARTRKRGSVLPGATAADLAAKFGNDEALRLLENAKQVSRADFLSTCAINHNEERFMKQMKRSSEKRMALVWGVLTAVVVIALACVVGHFWFAGAKKELEEWRTIRAAKEKSRLEKQRAKENALKAEMKRKEAAEAAAKKWQADAVAHVERVLRCGVHGTIKDGVKKGGVHRCVLFGQDGKGLSKEAQMACGVCVEFLKDLGERLEQSSKGKTEAEANAQLNAACKKADGRVGKVCDSLFAVRKDATRQLAFGAPPAKICKRLSAKDAELCAVKQPKEGELSSDGKGDAAARDAFKKLSVFVHPDKHDNSEASTEAFKMLNTARAYMDSKAKLNAKRAKNSKN